MLLDALCHPGRARDPAAFLDEAAQAGVGHLVLGGYSPETWAADAALSHPALRLHRSVGVHPWLAHEGHPLPQPDGAIAIGEIGLDRARSRETAAQQQAVFTAQLDLARQHGLPVVLHVVRAHGMALALLDAHPPPGGVVHGFSGAPEVAREYLRRGLHISFGGMLLHPRARKAALAAQAVPLDRILIETDAPDQLPGPAALHQVLDALAALRDEPRDVIAQATVDNGLRAYQL